LLAQGFVTPLADILAIIFAVPAMRQTRNNNLKGRALAIIGLVLGIVSLVIIAVTFGFQIASAMKN
jgi:hypothetical protein